jgi:hypothetical protein
MAAQWLNSHLEEKKHLLSSSKVLSQKRSNNFGFLKNPAQKNYHYFELQKFPLKIAYTLLVVLALSSFLSFYKAPSMALVKFFDSIFLAPFKLIAQESSYQPISKQERSNYIINNFDYLREQQKNNITVLGIETSDISGHVAGASEAKDPKYKNIFPAFLNSMFEAQKNLSLNLSNKLKLIINGK